jgi:hypothetical protein
LLYYFEKVLERSFRNGRSRLVGNAISPRLVYLDAKRFKVNNVFEASYFIKNTRNIYPIFGIKLIMSMLVNSFKYRLLSFKKKAKLSSYV